MASQTYNEKIEEIDKIIEEIQEGEFDLDKINHQVSKAKKLIDSCKNQIIKTEEKMNKIIDE